MYWIILIGFGILSWAVSRRLKNRFRAYAEVPTSSGLSGAEIAEKMLRDNNIHDVKVSSVEGELTDHYNPKTKTINLSRAVFHGRNVAAAAVAAHETGHAVQHATAYAMLSFRSAMVPMVNLSSKLMNVIFIVAILGGAVLGLMPQMFILIIVAQAIITLFSLVTLPVEFDASARALQWLNMSKVTQGEEHAKAKNALQWAASTYVVATLAAITQLLYFILAFGGSRD
ncbi:MAG: zinc metallopeptidase [Flavobacteriales bacterium]|nr:zinc metallopeptidase [Flavobacteriales bacterium]